MLITPKRNLVFISSHSLFFISPQLLATTTLLPASTDLSFLEISYKSHHTLCSLLWQTSFFSMFSGWIHIDLVYVRNLFLFMANTVPSCGSAIFYLSVHQLMDIWVVSTFLLLGIMLLWTFLYRFLCGHVFSFLLGIYLGVELLGYMTILYLTFWGIAELFFRVVSLWLFIL